MRDAKRPRRGVLDPSKYNKNEDNYLEISEFIQRGEIRTKVTRKSEVVLSCLHRKNRRQYYIVLLLL